MPIWRTTVETTHPNMPNAGINTWHFGDGDSGDSATALLGGSTILEAFYEDVLGPGIAPSAAITHDGVWVDVATGTEVQTSPWTLGTGTAGPTLPPANTVCISWRTGTAQRSGVGRTFLGPVLDTQADDAGTPGTTGLALIRAAATTLVTSNTNGFPDFPGFGVYSRQLGTIRQFQSGRVRDQYAVLRSRRD